MPEKKKILVADDESLNYLFYSEIIDLDYFELIYVDNGNDAIKKVYEMGNDISLVLMDLKMPELDGFSATKEIRKFNATIPIIAQTAYAYKEDYDNAIAAGCNGYISKPIHEKELLSKIFSFLPQNS
ncbi:MAG: response regulator [Bacteroidales bacterium]|nr:response regulator [Bacteroidales bacterium]